MPTRKSERLAKRMVLMTSVLLTQRKKIGVGEHFQAEIPEWTGPPSDSELSCYRNDPNISKMLGSRIWPPEGEILPTDIVVAGQGRPESCSCRYPGSFFCRQHHINAARVQLRSEIGQAFREWKFDSMGDQVLKMWSMGDQLKFNELEQLVPVLENKSFWAIASKHFASKTRRDLVQYYMNVFLMRRVLSQCRLSLLEIDSDEDEPEEEEDEDQSDGSNSSQRYCSTHGPVCLCKQAKYLVSAFPHHHLPFIVKFISCFLCTDISCKSRLNDVDGKNDVGFC